MKNSSTVLLVATAFPLNAMALDLITYENPESSFESAYVDFNANANAGNQDQTSFNSLIDVQYSLRRSEEKRVWGLRGNAVSNASRGPNDGDKTNSEYGFEVGAYTDVYFNEARPKLFYFGDVSYAHESSAADDNIGVTAGIGYGRVWNATPLAKALRIQEAFKSHGLLSQDLTDEQLMQLADVIAREDEYRVTHGVEDYKGAWYTDMEAVMVGANALPSGSLSALATVKLDDVLFNEPISARRHGWVVRAGAGFQSSDFSGLTDNDPKLTFQAEYAKPVGLRGQWINLFSYEPIFGSNTVHTVQNRLSYTHEISDRIDWVNGLDTLILQADDRNDSRFTSNTLSSGFNFHVTNTIDLALTFAAIKTSERPNVDRTNDEVSTSAVIGVKYRLK